MQISILHAIIEKDGKSDGYKYEIIFLTILKLELNKNKKNGILKTT